MSSYYKVKEFLNQTVNFRNKTEVTKAIFSFLISNNITIEPKPLNYKIGERIYPLDVSIGFPENEDILTEAPVIHPSIEQTHEISSGNISNITDNINEQNIVNKNHEHLESEEIYDLIKQEEENEEENKRENITNNENINSNRSNQLRNRSESLDREVETRGRKKRNLDNIEMSLKELVNVINSNESETININLETLHTDKSTKKIIRYNLEDIKNTSLLIVNQLENLFTAKTIVDTHIKIQLFTLGQLYHHKFSLLKEQYRGYDDKYINQKVFEEFPREMIENGKYNNLIKAGKRIYKIYEVVGNYIFIQDFKVNISDLSRVSDNDFNKLLKLIKNKISNQLLDNSINKLLLCDYTFKFPETEVDQEGIIYKGTVGVTEVRNN